MKRLMMAHVLCAGLLMLSLESQGAGAGKKVAPKKKVVAKKKKSAAAGAGAGAQPKKKLVKTPAAVQPKPAAGAGAGAPPTIPAWKPTVEELFDAASKGNVSMVATLLERDATLLNKTDKRGRTVLIAAVQGQQPDVIQFLGNQKRIDREMAREAFAYANAKMADVLMASGFMPPVPVGMPPVEEKKKVAAGAGAPPIPAWQEEKKKEAAVAGTPPAIPAWTVETITDPSNPVNVEFKKAVNEYTNYAGTPEMNEKRGDKIIDLLEQGSDLALLDSFRRKQIIHMLLNKNKYGLAFEVIKKDKALFREVLRWILSEDGQQRMLLLDLLIGFYKQSGGEVEDALTILDEWAYHRLDNWDEGSVLNKVREAAKIMVNKGATLGKPIEFRAMGHAAPEVYSNPKVRKVIEEVMQEYKEQRRKEIGAGAAPAGLPAGIAGIIAEYEGSKAPTEQSEAVGFVEKEESVPAAAGAPQLGSGMGLGGLAEDVAAGAGAGAPPAIPALTEEDEGGASVMEQVG